MTGDSESDEHLLSLKEAMELTGFAPTTLRRAFDKGLIEGKTAEGRSTETQRLFQRKSLLKWAEDRPRGPRPRTNASTSGPDGVQPEAVGARQASPGEPSDGQSTGVAAPTETAATQTEPSTSETSPDSTQPGFGDTDSSVPDGPPGEGAAGRQEPSSREAELEAEVTGLKAAVDLMWEQLVRDAATNLEKLTTLHNVHRSIESGRPSTVHDVLRNLEGLPGSGDA